MPRFPPIGATGILVCVRHSRNTAASGPVAVHASHRHPRLEWPVTRVTLELVVERRRARSAYRRWSSLRKVSEFSIESTTGSRAPRRMTLSRIRGRAPGANVVEGFTLAGIPCRDRWCAERTRDRPECRAGSECPRSPHRASRLDIPQAAQRRASMRTSGDATGGMTLRFGLSPTPTQPLRTTTALSQTSPGLHAAPSLLCRNGQNQCIAFGAGIRECKDHHDRRERRFSARSRRRCSQPGLLAGLNAHGPSLSSPCILANGIGACPSTALA